MDPLIFSIVILWTGYLLMFVGELVPEINTIHIGTTTEANLLSWAGLMIFLVGVGLYIGAP